ncbi:MAG: LysE family transporter [Planctomycetes bacterium]|nr:LysE family transporter [Planctomycetota bacterium]
MDPPLIATVTFVLATTFSPGPNNVLSASIAMQRGSRGALPFLLGIGTGFSIVMLVCAGGAAFLREVFPGAEPVLKHLGAAYILWLAWSLWAGRARFGTRAALPPSQGYCAGLGLQFVNPKVVVYGLTLYSTFLADRAREPVFLAMSALALAAVSFASISTWAAAGAAIRRLLTTDRARSIVAAVLALSLVYAAAELVGAPGWFC